MFHVHAFNPHPLLRQCVDSYLIISVDSQESGFIENTLLPHITQSLVFGLDDGNTLYDCNRSEFSATHFIAGCSDEVCRVRFFPGLKKMIVNFKPGGFFKIFQIPVHYFNNRSLDAEVILGESFTEVAHKFRTSHLSEKIELTDTFLLNQLQRRKKTDRNIDEAIRLIERSRGNISLRELELATFTTKRTLERHFLEQVGFYPKTFSRLVRFAGVIRCLETNLNIKWRQLADIFGYYDQSHFINEFKLLTGGLPQDYFSLRTDLERIMQV
jgi:AraC-like DNA-binding protein